MSKSKTSKKTVSEKKLSTKESTEKKPLMPQAHGRMAVSYVNGDKIRCEIRPVHPTEVKKEQADFIETYQLQGVDVDFDYNETGMCLLATYDKKVHNK